MFLCLSAVFQNYLEVFGTVGKLFNKVFLIFLPSPFFIDIQLVYKVFHIFPFFVYFFIEITCTVKHTDLKCLARWVSHIHIVFTTGRDCNWSIFLIMFSSLICDIFCEDGFLLSVSSLGTRIDENSWHKVWSGIAYPLLP